MQSQNLVAIEATIIVKSKKRQILPFSIKQSVGERANLKPMKITLKTIMSESTEDLLKKVYDRVKHLPLNQSYVIDVIEEVHSDYLGHICIEGGLGTVELIKFTLGNTSANPPANDSVIPLTSISQLIPIVHNLDNRLNGRTSESERSDKYIYTKKAKLVSLLGAAT